MKKNHMFVPTIIFLTIGTILYGISLYIKISMNMMLEPKTEPVENGQYLIGILALELAILVGVWAIFYFPSIIIFICIFIFNFRAYIKSEKKETSYIIQYSIAIILFALTFVLNSIDFSCFF